MALVLNILEEFDMNQPARQASLASAPGDGGATLPQPRVADALCVLRQLAMRLGRAVHARFRAFLLYSGAGQAGGIGSVRSLRTANLG